MSTVEGKRKAREEASIKAMGQPRKWINETLLQEDFTNYINYCLQQEPKRIPNIAGFCVYADCTRETFYKQEEYYSDTYQKMRLCLEDQTINLKDTIRSIFLLKANFGYRDSDPAQSAITVNYNNVPEGQLESWLRDSGLTLSEPSEE